MVYVFVHLWKACLIPNVSQIHLQQPNCFPSSVILESIPHVSLEEMIILQASWRLNPFYVELFDTVLPT
jgi:hypothetical protein